MSDTPITDALYNGSASKDEWAKSHADLERQLAEAQKNERRHFWLRQAGWWDTLEAIIKELESSRKQLAEAQKDAERYRWLRQAGWIDDAIMDAHDMRDDKPESLDGAIDREAALSAWSMRWSSSVVLRVLTLSRVAASTDSSTVSGS